MQISNGIYSVDPHGSGVIKGIKCALAWMGICSDLPAEPLGRLPDVQRQLIRQRLEEMGLPLHGPEIAVSGQIDAPPTAS
jgi:hypothetical protein